MPSPVSGNEVPNSNNLSSSSYDYASCGLPGGPSVPTYQPANLSRQLSPTIGTQYYPGTPAPSLQSNPNLYYAATSPSQYQHSAQGYVQPPQYSLAALSTSRGAASPNDNSSPTFTPFPGNTHGSVRASDQPTYNAMPRSGAPEGPAHGLDRNNQTPHFTQGSSSYIPQAALHPSAFQLGGQSASQMPIPNSTFGIDNGSPASSRSQAASPPRRGRPPGSPNRGRNGTGQLDDPEEAQRLSMKRARQAENSRRYEAKKRENLARLEKEARETEQMLDNARAKQNHLQRTLQETQEHAERLQHILAERDSWYQQPPDASLDGF
ncbi:hypothetical protein CYLTODRAFT_495265 [Cylindrobasidium torrendii FP15055 ss-10]|uniref:BZIP domain-containing protein n=1 Tax=Cylindrobasidium torrendii FP15055 ss-10 TaxID=1314674 RepID=A0A0D7AST1_9AGAR|nr:hypothetical protein CYLTODRAFT_495265 [Cylindrobasidium torrendii FP15055 ss-10]